MSGEQRPIGDNFDSNYDLADENGYDLGLATSSAMMHSGSRNNPDVISHQPTVTPPGQKVINTPWTYSPSGSRPLQRQEDPQNNSTNIYNNATDLVTTDEKRECISRSSLTPPETVQPGTSAFGSRDWSSDIFASFLEVRKSATLGDGLKAFLRDCLCVPCMMCDIAKGLGDKVFLPFIPGTGAAIRFKVRILGGIQGSIADDCLMTSFCCPCAVCQMYREIDDIGLAPA